MSRTEIVGWIVFLVCSVLFLAAGIRDGDLLITAGSLLFLVGCGVFLASGLRR